MKSLQCSVTGKYDKHNYFRLWRNRTKLWMMLCTLLFLYIVVAKSVIYVLADQLVTYVLSSQDDMLEGEQRQSHQIPLILHTQWKTRKIPKQVAGIVKSWSHHSPQLQHWFWTEDSLKYFGKERLNYYNKMLSLSNKKKKQPLIDMETLRFFILYEYGGIFSELDFELLKSLNSDILSHPCIIAQEPQVTSLLLPDEQFSGKPLASDAIILCRPKHPFIKFVINKLASEDGKLNQGRSKVLQFNDLVHRYIAYTQSLKEPNKEDAIFLAPSNFFIPTWNNKTTNQLRTICDRIIDIGKYRSKKLQLNYGICNGLIQNNFANVPTASSYTKHHWLDGVSNIESRETVEITHVIANITMVLFPSSV